MPHGGRACRSVLRPDRAGGGELDRRGRPGWQDRAHRQHDRGGPPSAFCPNRQPATSAPGWVPSPGVRAGHDPPAGSTDAPQRLRAILDELTKLGLLVLLPVHPRSRGPPPGAGSPRPSTGCARFPPADHRTFLGLARPAAGVRLRRRSGRMHSAQTAAHRGQELLLDAEPLAAGWADQRWTLARIQDLVAARFGIGRKVCTHFRPSGHSKLNGWPNGYD
jgi:hypothetical protein